MNQAIFEKILITEDGIEAAVFAQPFAELYDEDFVADLESAAAELRGPTKANRSRLSSAAVGMRPQSPGLASTRLTVRNCSHTSCAISRSNFSRAPSLPPSPMSCCKLITPTA